jgi:hypothetical protein
MQIHCCPWFLFVHRGLEISSEEEVLWLETLVPMNIEVLTIYPLNQDRIIVFEIRLHSKSPMLYRPVLHGNWNALSLARRAIKDKFPMPTVPLITVLQNRQVFLPDPVPSLRSHVVLPVFAQLFKTLLKTTILHNFLQCDLQICIHFSLHNQYIRATWSDLERNCIRRNTSRCIVSLSASSKSITRCKKPTKFPSSLALPAFNKWIWPSVGKPIKIPQLIYCKCLMCQTIMYTIL